MVQPPPLSSSKTFLSFNSKILYPLSSYSPTLVCFRYIPRSRIAGSYDNSWGFPSKVSACNARDWGLITGLGRSSGKGNGYLLQYSCLENPHGQKSLESYSPWGHKESDTTEQLTLLFFNDNSMFRFLRNCQTISCNDWTILYPHQKKTRAPVSPHPLPHFYLFLLFLKFLL